MTSMQFVECPLCGSVSLHACPGKNIPAPAPDEVEKMKVAMENAFYHIKPDETPKQDLRKYLQSMGMHPHGIY